MSILDNKIYRAELDEAIELLEPIRSYLKNKSIVITGATGVIGREIVDILMHENLINGAGITIHAVGRSKDKIKRIFSDYIINKNFVTNDYNDIESNTVDSDYVIHLASVTSSKEFIEKPIEVLTESFSLMKTMLDFACLSKADNFAYISSVEAYGNPYEWQKSLKESDMGYISTTEVRSSYPIAKNLCEMLTTSYVAEKGLRAVILRPCKSFGLAFDKYDKRLFADFADKAFNKQNIVLRTKADELYSCCYIMDVALSIIFALINGKSGEVYNISNKDSVATVKDIAGFFAEIENVKIEYDYIPNSVSGYIKLNHSIINSDKLKDINYTPRVGLREGIARLMAFKKECTQN